MANQHQVKAKKHLGQHFLKDENVARKIADTLTLKGYENVLEIGPGMGVLTKYLLEKDVTTYVAQRICSNEGSKVYGILSVLTQAFYHAEYMFTVSPTVFHPPPKVDSGVLRLIRKKDFVLLCDEELFFKVVKTAFGQRRKTLRNSLKTFNLSDNLKANSIFGKRPEQLSVQAFIELTELLNQDKG